MKSSTQTMLLLGVAGVVVYYLMTKSTAIAPTYAQLPQQQVVTGGSAVCEITSGISCTLESLENVFA